MERQKLAIAQTALLRHLYYTGAIQVIGRERVLLQEFLGRADKHDVAALASRQWPDVNDIISLQHHFLVVFNNQDCVAVVAQGLQ